MFKDYSEQERLIRSNINSAKKKGLEEGFEEGKRVNQLEVAKMLMINTKSTLEEISLCTGLILDEVMKLQE